METTDPNMTSITAAFSKTAVVLQLREGSTAGQSKYDGTESTDLSITLTAAAVSKTAAALRLIEGSTVA